MTQQMKSRVKIYILTKEPGNFKDEDRFQRARIVVSVLGRVTNQRLQEFVRRRHPSWIIVEFAFEILK
jgi:hypothetical protein